MAGKKGKPIDPSSIPVLLEKAGWDCTRISDDVWRSHFRGRNASLPFFVRIDASGYVHFAIVPFVKSPEEPDKAAKLYNRLLQLNHSLLMAKFSIDDDLDVVLSVEHPLSDLDKSELEDALDVLSYYADRHYSELAAIIAT